jgi:hypothetical protein
LYLIPLCSEGNIVDHICQTQVDMVLPEVLYDRKF